MAQYRGVILDVDGTLVDSNRAHAQAWVEALAEHGHEVALEGVLRLIGKGGDKLLPEVTGGVQKDSPEGSAIDKRRKALFKERYLPALKPLPGVRELVERLQAEGRAVVVASSASKGELGPLLEAAGVADLLTERTSADDAEESKPEPDIVEAALAMLAMPPGEAVMIGDTPYDVEAASRAGVAVIGMRSGGWDDAGLDGAIAIFDHPADLLANFDASPLGRG